MIPGLSTYNMVMSDSATSSWCRLEIRSLEKRTWSQCRDVNITSLPGVEATVPRPRPTVVFDCSHDGFFSPPGLKYGFDSQCFSRTRILAAALASGNLPRGWLACKSTKLLDTRVG